MGILDKFLDAIKVRDDYDDDDDEFLDDDLDEEYEDKPRHRFFGKKDDDDELEDLDDLDELDAFDDPEDDSSLKKAGTKPVKKSYGSSSAKAASKSKSSRKSSKITPIRKKSSDYDMEVNVIRPTSMEDTRDIADTLLENCTVVLNLEGLDMDMAQRIIDFTSGACYAVNGSLQRISSYIFILTPTNVDISGDFENILSGSFDLPSMKAQY